MCLWELLILFVALQSLLFESSSSNASILNTLLGVPGECVHQSKVWQCKLSFSCWLQGGRHASGCGKNRWLFSCCLEDEKSSHLAENMINEMGKKRIGGPPKRLISKRRNENHNNIQSPFECGLQVVPAALQRRIIGGHPARFAEYPWQAHIRIAEFQCGGVLISDLIVATAAHCIMNAKLQEIVVFLGELDTQNGGYTNEPLPAEKHMVSQKIVHPRFRFRMTQPDRYDLALLKLTKRVEFSDHIIPVCLPQKPIHLIGRMGLIAGWGKTEDTHGHSGTNMLQIASVPIISSLDCIKWHKMKRIHVELFEEMICAGHSDGHQDACLGDSGGPLIIRDRGRYTLVGITSAGFGCGIEHQPGIYHNIQKTTQWIRNIIKSSNTL